MSKHGNKHCFKQDTSSASKQDTSMCTYVTDVLTKNLLTFSSLAYESTARENRKKSNV